MPQQLNMISIHTIESKKNYYLYVPGYCLDNIKKISDILKEAKKILKQYSSNSKINKIIITNELTKLSFPSIYPMFKNENTYKYKPVKIIYNLENVLSV